MAQFMSTIMSKIDAKGRVSVPSAFRSVIAAQKEAMSAEGEFMSAEGEFARADGIFLYPSFTEVAIEGGGGRFMADISAMVERLDVFTEARDALATSLFADSHHLSFDTDGRVIFPAALLAHAGIEKEVCFVGLGTKFQIWEPKSYARYRDKARLTALENRKILRALSPKSDMSGDTTPSGHAS